MLEEKGEKLDFLLDEGMFVMQGVVPGVEDPVVYIGDPPVLQLTCRCGGEGLDHCEPHSDGAAVPLERPAQGVHHRHPGRRRQQAGGAEEPCQAGHRLVPPSPQVQGRPGV